MNNIRYQIRPSTGRDVIKIGKYIIKYSNNLYEIFYEYQNLLEIASSNTKLFRVPKVINLIKGQNYGAIIMEYVSGPNLNI
jgi:archaellin